METLAPHPHLFLQVQQWIHVYNRKWGRMGTCFCLHSMLGTWPVMPARDQQCGLSGIWYSCWKVTRWWLGNFYMIQSKCASGNKTHGQEVITLPFPDSRMCLFFYYYRNLKNIFQIPLVLIKVKGQTYILYLLSLRALASKNMHILLRLLISHRCVVNSCLSIICPVNLHSTKLIVNE